MKIQESVKGLIMREEERELHAACAHNLEGLVRTSQLAMHFEHGNMPFCAAQQCSFGQDGLFSTFAPRAPNTWRV